MKVVFVNRAVQLYSLKVLAIEAELPQKLFHYVINIRQNKHSYVITVFSYIAKLYYPSIFYAIYTYMYNMEANDFEVESEEENKIC